ncbi:MAG: Mur ligase family protein [Patescibacteria group bacterium]
MKKILQLKLRMLARLILKKYQPVVVGITGSIGKTSAKEAVGAVLKDKLTARLSPKNYNNEIGFPLTVIGAESAGRNIGGWLLVFFRALRLILITDRDYPRVLVLEMGVDRPGDMAYLTGIVKPQVGLVTAVSYSHLEYFGSLINIKKEKQGLIESLDNKGLAILNYDNDLTREMAGASQARVLTYGLQAGADLLAQDIVYNFTKGNYEFSGLNFKMNYKGSIVPVFMSAVMTETAIYAALAAAAVGLYFDLNLVEIARALSDFSLPPGRMNVLPGIKKTFIIDDTYNSSPEAAISALDVLRRLKTDDAASKYAVLGDMLEIGHYTEEGHRLVGAKAAESGLGCLIAVGEKARDIARGAVEAGLADNYVFCFDRAEEAGRFLQNRLKAGDVILVKGSQGMRLEKIIKEIMAEPERAEELLVRQGKDWEI